MTVRSPLKDKPRRNPGQSLDEKITELIYVEFSTELIGCIFFIFIAAHEWARYFHPVHSKPIILTFMAFIGVIFTFYKFKSINKQLKQLRQGRDGEKVTGQFLEKLRSKGCMIYHDILGDQFNLDHVIISEKGIFVVETKTYSKSPSGKNIVSYDNNTLLINGSKSLSNPIIQVSASSYFLREVLLKETGINYEIQSFIVYPGWYIEGSVIQVNKSTSITNPKMLPNILEKKSVTINKEDARKASSGLSRYIRKTELLNEKLKKAG